MSTLTDLQHVIEYDPTWPDSKPYYCTECNEARKEEACAFNDALTRVLTEALASFADDEDVVQALTYEVMNEACDLADRDPGEKAWAELEEDVRDVLRFLPRAVATAQRGDS